MSNIELSKQARIIKNNMMEQIKLYTGTFWKTEAAFDFLIFEIVKLKNRVDELEGQKDDY